MDFNTYFVFLPATIALAFKASIFAYARQSKVHNIQVQVYLCFLIALSVQNIAELLHFYGLQQGRLPEIELKLYYAASIAAIPFIFHLVLNLAFDRSKGSLRFATISYAYAFLLEVLLLATPWLIEGFVHLNYSATRLPGPFYFLFEIYAIAIPIVIIGILLYATKQQNTATKRAKAATMLLAIIPMVVVVIGVLTLLHFGFQWVNASVILPIAITYFLVVTAYAIHQHRLFDIQFFIPWSRVRKRKTAFYKRIRRLITEIADLESVNEAINRLSDTLRCPVGLIGTGNPVFSTAAGSRLMSQVPIKVLRKHDHIIVANEIVDSVPDTYSMMKQSGVAAAVPFHPHSKNASGWLLLGDAFSEQVYTPLDFRMVEQLFDKMADLFLDKLVAMRSQFDEAVKKIDSLKQLLQKSETANTQLQDTSIVLRQENFRLRREQPADALSRSVFNSSENTFSTTITLLGRDKTMLKSLRKHFNQVSHYVGPGSTALKKQIAPAILICQIDKDCESIEGKLIKLIKGKDRSMVLIVYGGGSGRFANRYKKELLGSLAECVPEFASEELFLRKVRAMAGLRNAVHTIISESNLPIIGESQVFNEFIVELKRAAGFSEPVIFDTKDTEQAIALANYLSELSGNKGLFKVIRAKDLRTQRQHLDIATLVRQACGGSLMIDDIYALPEDIIGIILNRLDEFGDIRLLAGSASRVDLPAFTLLSQRHPFILTVPDMRQRRVDIQPLTHYFTLQYNLQAGSHQFLSQSEVDDLMDEEYPANLTDLKYAVFRKLHCRQQNKYMPAVNYEISNKTLDEHLADFEALTISRALKRCDGNKSKTARLLGVRPNTLHYKMERHGVFGVKKR